MTEEDRVRTYVTQRVAFDIVCGFLFVLAGSFVSLTGEMFYAGIAVSVLGSGVVTRLSALKVYPPKERKRIALQFKSSFAAAMLSLAALILSGLFVYFTFGIGYDRSAFVGLGVMHFVNAICLWRRRPLLKEDAVRVFD